MGLGPAAAEPFETIVRSLADSFKNSFSPCRQGNPHILAHQRRRAASWAGTGEGLANPACGTLPHEASEAASSTRTTLDRVNVIFTPLSSSMRSTTLSCVESTEITVP